MEPCVKHRIARNPGASREGRNETDKRGWRNRFGFGSGGRERRKKKEDNQGRFVDGREMEVDEASQRETARREPEPGQTPTLSHNLCP